MNLSREEKERLLKSVKYVKDMLFLDPLVGNPIPGTELYINRKPYPKEIRGTNRDELIRKGKMRVWERGFDTQDIVTGNRKESLYRSVSIGLTGEPDDYQNIYLLGVMQMNRRGLPPSDYNMSKAYYQRFVESEDVSGLQIVDPRHVLLGAAEALSVRFVVFNAMGKNWVAEEFAPPVVGTRIVRTAYVLCVPTLHSVSFSYSLVRVPGMLWDDVLAQPMDEMKRDRIWRQNTIPEAFTPTLEQEQRIEMLKSLPGFSRLRCLYKEDEDWVPPN